MIDTEALKRDTPIESVIGRYVQLKRGGNSDELVALCPFHKEKTPSFTVTKSKGLFKCFGCDAGGDVFEFIQRIEGISFQDAIKHIGGESSTLPSSDGIKIAQRAYKSQQLAPGVLIVKAESIPQKVTAEYLYVDEHREVLYRVQRVEPGKNGKSKEFRQSRPHPIDGCWVNGISAGSYRKRGDEWYSVKHPSDYHLGDDEIPEVRRVLFNLPELKTADTVYVVEGEKDCLTLKALGFVATTNSGGAANKWLPEYSEALRGKRVVILPDQDEPGKKRGAVIAEALKGIAAEVAVFDVPSGKDVTDWLGAGGDALRLTGVFAEADEKRRAAELEEKGLWSVNEIVENYRGGVNAFLDPTQRPKGLSIGFALIDKRTLGLHRGELVILAARPSMGKTALALNIAQNVAERGAPVAVFSMEMSRGSLLDRAVCSRARLDQLRFRRGDYSRGSADDRHKLQVALSELAEMPLFIDQRPGINLAYIEKKATALRERVGLGLVVIDYLQLMGGKARENRQQEVNALSRGLKIMAQELDVPFVVLSQLSRAPDQRQGDNIPQLSDLRDSGGIEQDADGVWFIYRAEVYDKAKSKPELKGKADLIIAKQRNGPIGRIPLTFNAASTRFDDAAMEIRDEE